eukprot:1157110-Pelagomonas_calceolata.AAC.1
MTFWKRRVTRGAPQELTVAHGRKGGRFLAGLPGPLRVGHHVAFVLPIGDASLPLKTLISGHR